ILVRVRRGEPVALTNVQDANGPVVITSASRLDVNDVAAHGAGTGVVLLTTSSGDMLVDRLAADVGVTLNAAGTVAAALTSTPINIATPALAMKATAVGIGTGFRTAVSNLEAAAGAGPVYLANGTALIIGGTAN